MRGMKEVAIAWKAYQVCGEKEQLSRALLGWPVDVLWECIEDDELRIHVSNMFVASNAELK